MVLELRPNCECCDRDLPPASLDARICSFECTFCADCAEKRLGGGAPTAAASWCAARFGRRDRLTRNPASTKRGC